MTLNELSSKLADMYTNAPRKEQVTGIFLFGIKYHEQIKEHGMKAVVDQSGIPSTYTAELSKATRLAKYVKVIESEVTW